jgi:hypothetical protein
MLAGGRDVEARVGVIPRIEAWRREDFVWRRGYVDGHRRQGRYAAERERWVNWARGGWARVSELWEIARNEAFVYGYGQGVGEGVGKRRDGDDPVDGLGSGGRDGGGYHDV